MAGGWNRGVRWSEAVGEAVLAGTRAGKTLAELCVGPDMPSARAVVRWTAQRPAFRRAMQLARESAGLSFGRGLASTYDEATGLAICERLCAGDRVKDITADPEMPGYSTYFRWQNDIPEFRRAVALAREICALRLAEDGWEDACAVTPQTAFATQVKLQHLRWYASKLAPQKYGALKAADPAAGLHRVMHVYTKRFTSSADNDGSGRWSDEPARHLYSMIPTSDGPRGGEPLPPPAVVREPFTTQGPGATGEARGGSVEAEYEDEGETQHDWDDYWT